MLFPFPITLYGVGDSGSLPEDTWTEHPTGLPNPFVSLTDFAFGAGLYIVCGVQGDGTVRLATSPDLTTWTERTLPASFTTSTAVARLLFAEGIFVLVGGDSNGTQDGALATSTDGITWTSRASNVTLQEIGAILYDGTDFVIFGESGLLATSPTGITWTAGVTISNSNPRDAIYDSNNGLYVVGGRPAGGGILFTSPDKTTWTSRTTDGMSGVHGLAFSASLGLFAAGWTGTLFSTEKTKMNKSSNGTSWTAVVTPVDTLSRYAFWHGGCDFGNGKVMAVAINSTTTAIRTVKTTNGTNWFYSEDTEISAATGGTTGMGFGNGLFGVLSNKSVWTAS